MLCRQPGETGGHLSREVLEWFCNSSPLKYRTIRYKKQTVGLERALQLPRVLM